MTLDSKTAVLMHDRLRETLETLAGGIDRLPLVTGIALIDEWEMMLATNEAPEWRAVGERLANLRARLLEGDARPSAVGAAVADLGTSILEGPSHTDDRDLVLLFERIGHLLYHAGHALRGVHPS